MELIESNKTKNEFPQKGTPHALHACILCLCNQSVNYY